MQVLLLNPPFLEEHGKFSRSQRSPAITKSGTLYYPMWLAYAAGLLEQHGFEVTLWDCPAEGIPFARVEDFIRRQQPELVVLDTSTPSIFSDLETGDIIKSFHPAAFVLLVGPHVSALPEETLQYSRSVDGVALREYEHTLLDLAKALQDHISPYEVPGLCLRRNQETVRTQARELATDLDALPFVSGVYKRHLHYENYFYAHSRYPVVVIITGRGCPHKCIYCVYPQTFSGHRLRYRSIPNVIDEIEFILKEFPGVKEIMFEDDTLTISKQRCLAFAEEVLRRNLKFTWSANSRAEVDLETLKLLKRAGARLFCVGIESGDQATLDRMRKNLSLEKIRQFFRDARQAGILIHGCFLMGLPGETRETMERTLALAKELNPDTAQFFPIMVYPGTEAFRWAQDKNYLITEDFRRWNTSEGLHHCVVSRPGLTNRDLVEFCDRARREFYLRPTYLGRKLLQSLTDLHEFKRLLKGGWSLSRHLFKNDAVRQC
ncbi:MAG: B12-binding domain-containing radical SAM protein [Thermodesulfobacteriota bacterium]